MIKTAPKAGRIPLESIQLNGDTQSRARIDPSVVEDYAEQLKAGAKFPPITLYFDGETHWIGDGFHRAHAYVLAKRHVIHAEVRDGDRRDAILCAVGANDTHGMRRSNEDKRRAVTLLLDDPEWSQRSDNWIANQCRVSDKTVAKYREELSAPLRNSEVKRTGQDGRKIETSNIGEARKPLCVQPSMPRTDRDEREPASPAMPAEKPAPALNPAEPAPMPSSPMSAVTCIIVQLQSPLFESAEGKAALKHLAQWCLDQIEPAGEPEPEPEPSSNPLQLPVEPEPDYGRCLVCRDPLSEYDAEEIMCRGCRENAAAADANNAEPPEPTPPERNYKHELLRMPEFRSAFEGGGALHPDGSGGYVMRMPDASSPLNGMTCSSRARSAMGVQLGLDEVDDDVFAMPGVTQ